MNGALDALRWPRQWPSTRLFAVLVAMVFSLAACSTPADSDDSESSNPAASSAPSEAPEESAEGGVSFPLELVDGKLPPLPDGFPDRPITLWNAFDPGATDDLFNIAVAEIANKYSPVRLATQSNSMGPHIQLDLVDFLRDQPGADAGYHNYAVSWAGVTIRGWTLESLMDKNPLVDLEPIISIQYAPMVLVSSPEADFSTVEEMEEWARANPGELTLVASAANSGTHTAALAWAKEAGIEFSFIPTEGQPESRQLLLGGGSQAGMITYQPGMQDQFNVLMFTGEDPVPALPDVRTAAELGYNIPIGSERGIGTIPGVPQDHILWLHQLFSLVVEDPDFVASQEGFLLFAKTPEEVRETQNDLLDVFVPILIDLGTAVKDRSGEPLK